MDEVGISEWEYYSIKKGTELIPIAKRRRSARTIPSRMLDTLAAPFRYVKRKVVDAIAEKSKSNEKETEERKLLTHWTRQFENDRREKREWDDRFDDWEALYHGNRVFDNLREDTNETVRTIVNFPRMVVESQIDLNVPEPTFKPVAKDDEDAVNALESQVKYAVRAASPSIEEINLENERRVPKYGGTFIKVHWNNSIKRAGYVGDVEISNPHPKDIIPNAGATGLDDMEHYHHPVNRTARYVLRRWEHLAMEDLEQKAMLHREYDEMLGDQDIQVSNTYDADDESGLNKYTIIETTYRDEEGDIGKIWWSGDLLIKHLPKFFYRRDDSGEIMESEILPPGTSVFAGVDENGDPVFSPLEEPREAEYYVPECWDLVYQLYMPRDKCFWGISLMEDVKDIQESIKKVLHIEEEKILKGTTKIITNDKSLMSKIQDSLTEVIYSQQGADAIREIQMGNDGGRGIGWLNMMKEFLQLLTGATNPALGQETSSVTSGKQAQLYVAQANYKTDVKSAFKASAYRQLYRVVASFYMAFADYDRPYRLQGEGGRDTFGEFNRLNLLRDKNGNLVYPDYDIDIGAEAGFLKNKVEVFNMLMSMSVQGKLVPSPDNLALLRALNKLGVPYLADIIDFMEQEMQKAEEMQAAKAQQQQQQQQAIPQNEDTPGSMEEILAGLPPELQQRLAALPPDVQQQVLAEAFEGGM